MVYHILYYSILRYTTICYICYPRALGSAKVTSVLEPPGLDRRDNKRPDGLTVYPWKYGKPLVRDVTVVDTFSINVYCDYVIKGGRSRVPKTA